MSKVCMGYGKMAVCGRAEKALCFLPPVHIGTASRVYIRAEALDGPFGRPRNRGFTR